MKGFDGQFVMAWLLEQGTAPEVIPNGSMIMCLRHPSLNIRVIDSLNFLPMALAKLPGCFGLTELKKGYFPHLFNSRENQSYVGPLPEARYYSPDTMSTPARKAFLSWHEEHKGDVFNFQAEMLAYCRSDVDILRRCCLEFRAQFLDVAGVDPFQYVTIASACMATYRSGHIQPDTIAMVPTHGYVNSTNYSPDSIRWLDFVAASEGIAIQHALNGSGEHRIAGISVDGFCQETETVYQFQGCFFYGCSLCYDGDIIHPLKGVSMATLREKTEETTRKLRTQGFHVIEMWEHEFQREKEENPDLQAFLDQHHLRDRLHPRESFFGGRTNALKLFHEGDAKYVDFTSLYPWVNKYCVYPVGHPTIITESFGGCGKLLWNYPMPCDSSTESYLRSVSFPKQSSTSLFRSYIDLFLKIKQESSGWPSECVTEEARLKYIRQYEEREGVKWGMNVNKAQLTYVHTVPDFNKMLADPTKKIKDVFLPTPEVAAIYWDSAKEFVPQDASTNIFLATFTTAWARLKLYSEMEKLGRDVLYHDTDSIIYASNGPQ
ncbi:uncharacterized protein LOC118200234 [Stegodyphus dumicola]|uniref:uncharacterized protein LOC118200234 n=1 Tax=Stegodyphus dumicola TaxID=202533 RepID=UPI0015AD61F0|nr:uncharacterized protein LOC118200234 [Stegodyphus dumicola]